MKEKIACFTGHRHLSSEETAFLAKELESVVKNCLENGIRTFRVGGALGFDTLAALAVLCKKEKDPSVRLEMILPSPDQCKFWTKEEVSLYKKILKKADVVRYMGTSYYDGILQMRNRALVDGADLCIAYLRNSHGGGTAFTCSYALRNGLDMINLAEKFDFS